MEEEIDEGQGKNAIELEGLYSHRILETCVITSQALATLLQRRQNSSSLDGWERMLTDTIGTYDCLNEGETRFRLYAFESDS